MHVGSSSAEGGPFVDAARFVCSLLGPAPLGIVVLESNGRCASVNATLEALARHNPDGAHLVGVRIDLGTPDLDSAFSKAARGQIAIVETDSPPVLGNGQGQWKLHFLPFVVSSERGVAILFEDMTESRLATDAYLAAEQRFRMLVDSAADGIVIYRANILLYVNPEAVKLLGYSSSDDLVGRPLIDLVVVEHRPNFELRLVDLEHEHGSGLFETVFVRHDRATFPVECRTSHARVDEMGAGFLFFRNIAARKRIQLRRENARRVDALARLAKALGDELHSYAAELRHLATRERSSSQSPHALDGDLFRIADSMAARARAMKLLPEPDADRSAGARIEEVIARVCGKVTPGDMLMQSTQFSTVPLRSSSTLLVDLEPVPYAVRGHAAAIEAGLIALVSAALRSGLDGQSLSIRGCRNPEEVAGSGMTYLLSIAAGKGKHHLGCSSYGAGALAPAALTFGSWEQGQDLDLLGAFALLHAQGCWVDVQQNSGGLSFEVELSLDQKCALPDEAPESADTSLGKSVLTPNISQESARHCEEESPDTERSRDVAGQFLERAAAPVLICDDESRLATLTAGLLREYGFDVLTVRSGAEAVRTIVGSPVDIVILDVNLPGEDALDIITQLRSRSGVAVILSSGYTEEDIEPELLQHDAVKAFLAKPYGVEALVDTIDQVRMKLRQSHPKDASGSS